MAVKKYKCFVGYGNSAPSDIMTIGVLELEPSEEPVSILYPDNYLSANANGVSNAIALTNGFFNKDITFFGYVKGLDVLRSSGVSCVYPLNGNEYTNTVLTFSNKNSIRIRKVNSSYTNYFNCDMYLNSGTAGGITAYSGSNIYGDRIIGGFPSGKLYNTKIVHPRIVFTESNNAPRYMGLSGAYSNSSQTSIDSGTFPCTIGSGTSGNIDYGAFLTTFWDGIASAGDLLYYAVISSGTGGTVAPANFFATANEPRMFTVTPDAHHAIHSVNIYNLKNDALIPYQESAMDLLTGAKSYIFNMPAADVRIVVDFRSIEITIPVTVSYTPPNSGKIYTTTFSLLYDNSREADSEEGG